MLSLVKEILKQVVYVCPTDKRRGNLATVFAMLLVNHPWPPVFEGPLSERILQRDGGSMLQTSKSLLRHKFIKANVAVMTCFKAVSTLVF